MDERIWHERPTFSGLTGYKYVRDLTYNLFSGSAWDSHLLKHKLSGKHYVIGSLISNVTGDHLRWLGCPGLRVFENKYGGRGRMYFEVTEALCERLSSSGHSERTAARDAEVDLLVLDLIDLLPEKVGE